MMNMDYFCDYVVRKVKPINDEMIKNAQTLLKIIVTNATSGRIFYYTNKDEGVDLVEVMKASSAYPGFYYPLVNIDGKDCFDGNSFLSVPVNMIEKDGITDLLIVANITEDYSHDKNVITGFLYNLLTMPMGKAFRHRYHDRACNICAQLDYTFGRRKMPGEFNFFTLAPDYLISEAETRKGRLKKMAAHGRNKMKDVLTDI